MSGLNSFELDKWLRRVLLFTLLFVVALIGWASWGALKSERNLRELPKRQPDAQKILDSPDYNNE